VTTASDSIPTETYTGLTDGPFKARYTGPMVSMRHLTRKTDTTLSHHIWDHKQTGISWHILGRGHGYNQTCCSTDAVS
jgi:hypothetical protein